MFARCFLISREQQIVRLFFIFLLHMPPRSHSILIFVHGNTQYCDYIGSILCLCPRTEEELMDFKARCICNIFSNVLTL